MGRLLMVRGLEMGLTAETGERDRVLGERLLTIEWRHQPHLQNATPTPVRGC